MGLAAALGALTSLVAPVRPAVAALGTPILASAPALPCQVIRGWVGGECAPAAAAVVGTDVAADGADNEFPAATSDLVYQPSNFVSTPLSTPSGGRTTNRGARGVTVNVTIPRWEGAITMTVSSTPVELSPAALTPDGQWYEITGQLPTVTVNDSRYVSQPGWRVVGQVTDFSGGGPTFSGSYLGWTPVVAAQDAAFGGVTAGPAVTPGTRPGLTASSNLAVAATNKGTGTTVLGASLDLKVPANIQLGSESATLSITLVEHG